MEKMKGKSSKEVILITFAAVMMVMTVLTGMVSAECEEPETTPGISLCLKDLIEGVTGDTYDTTAYGKVSIKGSNYDDYRVVVYVETDKMYIQPVYKPVSARYRKIKSDGHWICKKMHTDWGGYVHVFLIEKSVTVPDTFPEDQEPLFKYIARDEKFLEQKAGVKAVPGFESVFAIVGLLIIAYLSRRRKW